MPLINGRDRNGPYWKWGEHGSKYYYTPYDKRGNLNAKKLAIKQAVAIHYSSGKWV